jgi:hypothetical protein
MTEKQYYLRQWTNDSLYYKYPNGSRHDGIRPILQQVEDKLNKQNKNICLLEKRILDIIDFIKENDGATREEFSKWWNEELMQD